MFVAFRADNEGFDTLAVVLTMGFLYDVRSLLDAAAALWFESLDSTFTESLAEAEGRDEVEEPGSDFTFSNSYSKESGLLLPNCSIKEHILSSCARHYR